MSASPISNEAQIAQKALEEILQRMQIPFPVSVKAEEADEQILLTIEGEGDLSALVGKAGQTLNALEMLVRSIAGHQLGGDTTRRITIDAENYRRQHTDELEELGREAAQKVLETGESVALPPMNARDRRTVHMVIAEMEGLATFSTGQDPYRHLVICLPGQETPDEG